MVLVLYLFALKGINQVDLVVSGTEQDVVAVEGKFQEFNLWDILHVEDTEGFLKSDQSFKILTLS